MGKNVITVKEVDGRKNHDGGVEASELTLAEHENREKYKVERTGVLGTQTSEMNLDRVTGYERQGVGDNIVGDREGRVWKPGGGAEESKDEGAQQGGLIREAMREREVDNSLDMMIDDKMEDPSELQKQGNEGNRNRKVKGFHRRERRALAEISNSTLGMMNSEVGKRKVQVMHANDEDVGNDIYAQKYKNIEDWSKHEGGLDDKQNRLIGNTNQESQQQSLDLHPGILRIATAVKVREQENKVGIGIVAFTNNDEVSTTWAMVERRKGIKQMEEAEAVKMALIKASEEGWRKIVIQSSNKNLVYKLCRKCRDDNVLGTILDDILNLTTLFEKCIFCSQPKEITGICNRIASLPMSSTHDWVWRSSLQRWFHS
ncbi:hypothetical protein ACH5RR_031983 [Cinchona calisaya]|uniref:RNase H type-1 domain-containing protein n=1 Tax=Cinchona calisaya TaxID=153742 RepID=A0ABD2YGU0_9GENT